MKDKFGYLWLIIFFIVSILEIYNNFNNKSQTNKLYINYSQGTIEIKKIKVKSYIFLEQEKTIDKKDFLIHNLSSSIDSKYGNFIIYQKSNNYDFNSLYIDDTIKIKSKIATYNYKIIKKEFVRDNKDYLKSYKNKKTITIIINYDNDLELVILGSLL